jgi:hypothetical protein
VASCRAGGLPNGAVSELKLSTCTIAMSGGEFNSNDNGAKGGIDKAVIKSTCQFTRYGYLIIALGNVSSPILQNTNILSFSSPARRYSWHPCPTNCAFSCTLECCINPVSKRHSPLFPRRTTSYRFLITSSVSCIHLLLIDFSSSKISQLASRAWDTSILPQSYSDGTRGLPHFRCSKSSSPQSLAETWL